MKDMRCLVVSLTFLLAASGMAFAQAGVAPKVTLDRASFAAEVTNDQREPMSPGAGRKFLWVTVTVAGAPQSIDLTKVALVNGAEKVPLIGADSAYGGDPKQFSMIAPWRSKDGKPFEPLEETRSVGGVSFAFTPGKIAVLKVNMPPQSFCLLFAVPDGFRSGGVAGLGAATLPLPAPAPGK
jgi:hypothetical protein